MNIPEEGYLLRVFIGESDKSGNRPLYEGIEDQSDSLQVFKVARYVCQERSEETRN
jgi:hypothetical protein